jgi:helix-turn-helix protein
MADRIVIKKNFKYRLYPNAAQIVAMDGRLAEACRLTPDSFKGSSRQRSLCLERSLGVRLDLSENELTPT